MAVPDAAMDPTDTAKTLTPAQKQRVTEAERAEMYRLRRNGHTLEKIAGLLNRSLETVHRQLEWYTGDTSEDAANVLKGGALEAAMRTRELTEHCDGRVALGASKVILEANKLVGQPQVQATIGVQMLIGRPGSPAGPDPLEAKGEGESHTLPSHNPETHP